jgi:hypothetical protein
MYRLASLSLSPDSLSYIRSVQQQKNELRLIRALEVVLTSGQAPQPYNIPTIQQLPGTTYKSIQFVPYTNLQLNIPYMSYFEIDLLDLLYDFRCFYLHAERTWLSR